MSKAYKGSDFERTVCKQLSLWWSTGLGKPPRDDIFWRSSQSGGRATQRMKKGVSTYGSYGDVAAVDPIGEPLLKLFTIELKRGSSYSCPGDLIDFKTENEKHPWTLCIKQAVRSYQQAGTRGWLLIGRRDHRRAIAYVDYRIFRNLQGRRLIFPRVRFILPLGGTTYDFVAVPFEGFLAAVPPQEIISCLSNL